MKKAKLLVSILFLILMTGCSSYRTNSDISFNTTKVKNTSTEVLILSGDIEDEKYTIIGPIKAIVNKLTVFHDNPTKEQVDIVLVEKSKMIGADAVIHVLYTKGIGLFTWGYMKGEGLAVKTKE